MSAQCVCKNEYKADEIDVNLMCKMKKQSMAWKMAQVVATEGKCKRKRKREKIRKGFNRNAISFHGPDSLRTNSPSSPPMLGCFSSVSAYTACIYINKSLRRCTRQEY